jgi:endonuclease/exonuclease/phosphatase family metal-dependent hydrolase
MQCIRLLSYNIQVGIESRHYGDYVSNGWKHILPHGRRLHNLTLIAGMLSGYDMVGLQEVDGGSIRSAFIDHTQFLARESGYPFWHRQINRDLGRFARHSNGLLSRVSPTLITEHRLPGPPGRGALMAEFATSCDDPLLVCVLHLALLQHTRRHQLNYILKVARDYRFAVLMGDFNCGCKSRSLRAAVSEAGLNGLDCELKTFPSWRPQRNLDHILVSPELEIIDARVLDHAISDHLPIGMEVALPDGIELLG